MKPEHRQKVSEGRKRYLRENPDRHPWKRSSKFKSVPCEHLKSMLRSRGVHFIEEFTPLRDFAYAIDIALPSIKVGIEVNGNQHYDRDGNLKPYYLERKNRIEAAGWKLIELHYTMVFHQHIIDLILRDLGNVNLTQTQLETYRQESLLNKQSKTLERQRLIDERQRLRQRLKQEAQQDAIDARMQSLLNSDIDTTEFGWVQKTAALWSISPQKVSSWLKKHFPEFYKNNCFKRNTTVA